MPPSPSIDGNSYSTLNFGPSFDIVLSTSLSNDVILVFANPQGPTVTSVTSPTLGNFNQLITAQPTVGYNASVWYAIATAPLTNETITVNLNYTGTETGGVALGVNGAYLSAPFDPNPQSLNAIQVATGPNITINISTSNPDDLIIGFAATGNQVPTTLPSVMTELVNENLLNVGYYSVSSAQTNLPLEATTAAPTAPWAWIVVTLTAGPPSPPPPPPPPPPPAAQVITTPSPSLPVWQTGGIDTIAGVFYKPVATPIQGAVVVQQLSSGVLQPQNTVIFAGGGVQKGQVFTRQHGIMRRLF